MMSGFREEPAGFIYSGRMLVVAVRSECCYKDQTSDFSRASGCIGIQSRFATRFGQKVVNMGSTTLLFLVLCKGSKSVAFSDCPNKKCTAKILASMFAWKWFWQNLLCW